MVDRCGACARQFSYSLHRCGVCGKPACADCAVRMGGAVFCSRTCAHVFYYGGHEDVDEDGEDLEKEDE